MKKENNNNTVLDWKIGFHIGVVTVVAALAFYLKDKIVILDNQL